MELTRKECYDYIKEHSELKSKIYEKFHLPYSCIFTGVLDEEVTLHKKENTLWNRIKRLFKK